MTSLFDVIYRLNQAKDNLERISAEHEQARAQMREANTAFQNFVGAYVTASFPAVVEISYKKYLLSFCVSSQSYQLEQVETLSPTIITDAATAEV